MPELPEVEVLVRHLAPSLKGKPIHEVRVHRARILRPTSPSMFEKSLTQAVFQGLERRGKFLLFHLCHESTGESIRLLGHLGMTGRMYLQRLGEPLPKHAAVSFSLPEQRFVFEDTRYFGRLTLDTGAIERLGPEPLGNGFTMDYFSDALKQSSQPIKVKLLDQSLVAGLGNIYASESLFRARISPRARSNKLCREPIGRLRKAIREVLRRAIQFGSTVPLDWSGANSRDRLFYYGQAPDAASFYEERLLVYDRAGQPCRRCGSTIRRLVQGARSTFYCPCCQPARG
ncbi:MAG TPA: bifunctional DNA-formamidopyrimidine glycosylase/DNA-(apurinic or apyrimidinic site) lyase [Candidatus Eisenbacteria bacterium]|jgi:formamidopyrimidine-DNA glycosylase|nr:bifunctional DNA-formamidopyrimidine glycosylase/DNA-(apurinic or apyrimidinic site) lyase [Candidatus Eisenbacteria bacterium]